MEFIEFSPASQSDFIRCLKKMSHYAYLNYLDDLSKNLIKNRFVFKKIEGMLYIKKSDDVSEICISLPSDELFNDFNELYDNILSFFGGELPSPFRITANGYNNKFIEFLIQKGLRYRYSAFELRLIKESKFAYSGSDLTFLSYESKYDDLYIDLLGHAFEKMRMDLDLKPYNWHEANRESSLQYFKEQQKLDNFQGVWMDNELVGITILDENNIEMIAVRNDLQGRGYGKQILHYLINKLINELKYKEIIIAVMEINKKALSLYKKAGFIEFSKTTCLSD